MRFLGWPVAIVLIGAMAVGGLAWLRAVAADQGAAGAAHFLYFAQNYAMLAATVLFSLALVLTVVAVLWRLIVGAGRHVYRATRLPGLADKPQGAAPEVAGWHQVAALAIVVLLVPDLFRHLLLAFYRLLHELFIDLPQSLLTAVSGGIDCIANGAPSRAAGSAVFGEPIRALGEYFGGPNPCFGIVLRETMRTYSSVSADMLRYSGLFETDLFSLALALLLFVALTLILSRVFGSTTGRAAYWVGFTGVSVFAIYLALSAILAVPLIQTDADRATNETVNGNAEQLRTRMTAIATRTIERVGDTDQTLLDVDYDAMAAKAAAEQAERGETIVRERLSTAVRITNSDGLSDRMPPPPSGGRPRPPRLPVSLGSSYDSVAQDIFEAVARNERLHVRLSESARRIEAHLDHVEDTMIGTAVELYSAETGSRLGDREATRHYFSILAWFEGHMRAVSAAVFECRQNLRDIETTHAQLVRVFDALPAGEAPDFYARKSSEIRRIVDPVIGGAPECDFSVVSTGTPPPRPAFGSSLGRIGAATSWLLSTESMPVTLIAGLVGFGLLGALVSRFGRETGRVRHEEGLGDLVVVVFTGFVAALVVYVAAYGGIAVTSEEGGNPNPYIVFGACLVGAIYSGEIFRWAYETFLRREAPDAETVEGRAGASAQGAPDRPTPSQTP